jgi:hypothetical protein
MNPTGTWTVRRLFIGRPGSLKLFYLVQRHIKALGSVNVTPSKTQVSFGRRRKFAWVWLPQVWTENRPQSSITLSFALPRRVRHRRIAAVVEPRTGHWTHHVVLESPTDFDSAVKGWILEAYLRADNSATAITPRDSASTGKKHRKEAGGRTSPNTT